VSAAYPGIGYLTVHRKPLAVAAAAKVKTYGEGDPALTYTLSEPLIEGDNFSGALSRAAGENAGVYAIGLGTLSAGNDYDVTFTGANFTIVRAVFTLDDQHKNLRYNYSAVRTFDFAELVAAYKLPADALTYSMGGVTGQHQGIIAQGASVSGGGILSFTLASGLTTDNIYHTATIPVTVSGFRNYEPVTVNLFVRLVSHTPDNVEIVPSGGAAGVYCGTLVTGNTAHILRVLVVDAYGDALLDTSVTLAMSMSINGRIVSRNIHTDPNTGIAEYPLALADAVDGMEIPFEATVRLSDGTDAVASCMLVVARSSSVAEGGREIPGGGTDEIAAVTPVSPVSGAVTAGPNPAARGGGPMKIFRTGSAVKDGTLTVYDALGNAVRRISVSDCAGVNMDACMGVAGNAQTAGSRRVIASWDLTDARGRPVADGTYLVRGVLTTYDNKRERVSVTAGVR
jgi:hypothetical protein